MPAIDAQVFLTNEGTPGTEQTPPAATDVIDFHACTFAAQGDILRRPVVRAHQDRLPPKRVPAKHWQIALETEVKAATAAGTAPELDLLFKSAGFDDTINAGVSVVYALRDDPISVVDAALTVRKEMTLDGITVIGIGCRFGGMEFSSSFDGQLNVAARGVGAYKLPIDQPALTSPTYNAGVPLVLLDTAGTPALLSAYAAVIRSVKIAVGNEARMRPSMRAAGGYVGPALIVRELESPVTSEWEIELVDITAHDFWSKWDAATPAASEITWVAGSRKLKIDLRNTTYHAPEMVSGMPNLYRITADHARSGTDPSMTMTFT